MIFARLWLLLALIAPIASASNTPSTLDDLAWLEGTWEGQGIADAPATETYSSIAGGQIVGHFRQLNTDGTVMFYELITIDTHEGRLRYRLKHFNADLTGWEEKSEVREFPLRERRGDLWDFSGLIIERIARRRMRASVQVQGKQGVETLVFHYRNRD